MIIKNEKGFGWGSLLMSILFFIAGWAAVNNPTEMLMTLGILFGVISLIQSFLSIFLYSELKRIFDRKPWPIIVTGIINLLIGLYLIMNPTISVTFFPILFAVWFVMDSIKNILVAFRLRKMNTKWFWIYFILGILGMLLGLFLASNLYVATISITFLIASYFFIAGIINLIDAFI